MRKKTAQKENKKDEFQEIVDELIDSIQPHNIFCILKQNWNEINSASLCDNLAETMNFYENFCLWLIQNKNLPPSSIKKAKELIKKIKKQKELLLKLRNCA